MWMGQCMRTEKRSLDTLSLSMEGPSKQEVIALSTTEAKYVAITHATKEALWLRTLIKELFGEIKGPTTLYSDNQSTIALTKDHQHHMCMKHIDIRFHFV